MHLSEAGQTWYDFAVGGHFDRRDPFVRFIAVWIAFNALYEQHTPGAYEGEQIATLGNDPHFITCHVNLLNHQSYKEAVDVLAESGVANLRTSSRRTIPDHTNLLSVLQCVYQVRCNLFHGGKDRSDERDRRLSAAGFIVIGNLLTYSEHGQSMPTTMVNFDTQSNMATEGSQDGLVGR